MIAPGPLDTPDQLSPRTLSIVGVILVVFGLLWSLAVNLPQQAILHAYPADWNMALYFAVEHLPTEAAFFSAVMLLVRALQRIGASITFGFNRFPLWTLYAIPLCIIAISIGNALWQLLILMALGIPLVGTDTAFADWLVHDPLTFWTLTLIYCAIAPPFEEMLFRGVLFQWLAHRLRMRHSAVVALLVSSLVFAVVHVDVVGAGGYFGLAICSALLLRYGRSIWPCIVLHAAMNGLYVAQSMGLLLR